MAEHELSGLMPLPYIIFWLRPVGATFYYVLQNPRIIYLMLTTAVWGDNLALVTLSRCVLVGVFGATVGYLIAFITDKVHSFLLAFKELAESLVAGLVIQSTDHTGPTSRDVLSIIQLPRQTLLFVMLACIVTITLNRVSNLTTRMPFTNDSDTSSSSSSQNLAPGIGINVLGAITTNLGTVLMKFHTEQRKGIGPYLRIGVTLFVLGTILTFLSFSLAPQTLLAGISAIQFVSNLVFSRYLLGEPVTFRSVLGTCWLIGGIALVVVSSANSDDSATVNYFFDEYYFSENHLVFICSVVGVVCFLASAFWFRTGVLPVWKHHSRSERVLVFELSLPRSQTPLTRFFLPTSFVMLSAMLGAQSVVSGKVLSLIIAEAFTDGQWQELYKGRTFLVLFLWVIAAIIWVIQLNRSLRVFAGAYIIPLTQVCWTSWTMISGGVVFQEFDKMASWQLPLFILGTLVLFWGVSLLAPKKKRLPQPHPSPRQQHHQQSPEVDNASSMLEAVSAMVSPSISALSVPSQEALEHHLHSIADPEQVEIGVEEAPSVAAPSSSSPRSTTGVNVLMSVMSVGALPDVETIERSGFHHLYIANSSVGRSPSASDISVVTGGDAITRNIVGVFDVEDPPYIRTRDFFKRWQNDRREIKRSKVGYLCSCAFISPLIIPNYVDIEGPEGHFRPLGRPGDVKKKRHRLPPPSGAYAAYDPWRSRFRDQRMGDSVNKSETHGVSRTVFSEVPPKELVIRQIFEPLKALLRRTDVVGIQASTGSGKTTQVPQMLLDHGREIGVPYRILVTQPRRMATLSVAMKVRNERRRSKGDEQSIGYIVHNISSLPGHLTTVDKGSVLYCTEGSLLASIGQKDGADFNGVTHLILDEVHERSKELDVLLGVVKSNLVGQGRLKIILMSASASVVDMLEYLKPGSAAQGNLLTVNENHYDIKEYYLEETVKLLGFEPPPSVKMNSSADVGDYVSAWASLPLSDAEVNKKAEEAGLTNYDDDELVQTALSSPVLEARRIPTELIESLLMWIINDWTDKMEEMYQPEKESEKRYCAVLIFLPGMGSIAKLMRYLVKSSPCAETFRQHYYFIPFHRVTAGQHASQLFKRLESVEGPRIKCVLATNVAETSLTIPDLRYVIDCCRQKVKKSKHYLEVWWAGKFNCLQRRGRTGRTCSGTCFHLVLERMFHFGLPDQLQPSIAREPLEDILLQSLCISDGRFIRGLDELLSFYRSLPHDPEARRVVLSASMLREAGALNKAGHITNRGRVLARLPLGATQGCGLLCARLLFNTGSYDDAIGFWLAVTLILLSGHHDIYVGAESEVLDGDDASGDDSDEGRSIGPRKKLLPIEAATEVHFGVDGQEARRDPILSDHFEKVIFEIEWEQKWIREGHRAAKSFAKRRHLRHSALAGMWTERDLLLDWLDRNGLAPQKHFPWGEGTKRIIIGDGWCARDLIIHHVPALETVLAAVVGSDICQSDAAGGMRTIDPPYEVGKIGYSTKLRPSESSVIHLYPQLSPDNQGYQYLQLFAYSGRSDGMWFGRDEARGRIGCLTPIMPATLVVASTARMRYCPGAGLYLSDKALMSDCEALEILWNVRLIFREAIDMVAEQWLDALGDHRTKSSAASAPLHHEGFGSEQQIQRARRMALAIGGVKLHDYNCSLTVHNWYQQDDAEGDGYSY
ncbi:ATP-dependent RNA helicase A [Perkinsus olseni]|uniref:ATP-dependent RNA helicase A n=1 Tax=Perkinsus olseni TaxID=32597 RepID=A0A7J6MBR5_PEROL|nr:ATP-dependent RNA helicase A [Perkinsus olseni]